MIFESFITPLIFLISISLVTGLTRALQLLGRIRLKQEFKRKPHFYFFFLMIKRLFPAGKWDSLFYLLSFTKYLLRILFATTCFYYVYFLLYPNEVGTHPWHIIFAIAISAAIALVMEFIMRYIANMNPFATLRTVTPISTFFLFVFSPITFFFLKIHKSLFYKTR